MKNTTSASTTRCTQNILKTYVRFITCGLFPLCSKYNNFFFLFFSSSFAKASKILILNVKTFPAAEIAIGKTNRCSYSTKYFF